MDKKSADIIGIKEKIKHLDDRIKDAQEDYQDEYAENAPETHNAEISEDTEKSARAGSEFLASVIAGGLIGYGIDWYFQTLPWGMISFLVLGFVSAVLRANAAMKENAEKTSEKNTK